MARFGVCLLEVLIVDYRNFVCKMFFSKKCQKSKRAIAARAVVPFHYAIKAGALSAAVGARW